MSEAVSFSSLRPHLAYLAPPQIELVEKAFDIAFHAHKGQTRVSGEPYITHPLEVTKILTTYYMDHISIIAGLLHDTIEDTAVTKQEIIRDFGDQVALLVDGLSKLKKAEFKTRQAAQGENFRKMLLAMAKDIRVIIIKLADRLHNMRTLYVLSLERKTRIATETLDIFSPIARRLGMHSVSLELESLAFKALYPKRYEVLTKAIVKVEHEHLDIMEKILNKIRNQLKKQKIKVVTLGSRKKNIYSIYRKMKRKGVSFAQLTDVYGARIVVDDREDVYRVLGLIHRLYLPVSEKFRDYVAVPKPNGYRSLHTVLLGPSGVPIEIQIRTKTMDDTASNGIASHWIYKTQDMDHREHKWLASLIDIQSFTQNPEEFIEKVKMDLFKDEVYVFTPAGQIIELPSDATAMDFAYAVHTDIGDHCVAAKVDRQLAPLSMVLSNGQTIEIITSKHAQPSAVWLDVVVTPKAKSCINNFLKNQYKQQSIQLGKKLLDVALKAQGQRLDQLTEDQLDAYLKLKHFSAMNDVFSTIGVGVSSAAAIATDLLAVNIDEPKVEPSSEVDMSASVPIVGDEGKMVRYARCCCPIPGDPVMGVINANQGLVVHRESCPKLLLLRSREGRCIHVHWGDTLQGRFLSTLCIHIEDRQGIIADITMILSKENLNIRDLRIKFLDDPQVELRLDIEIESRLELAKVIRQLRKLTHIAKISRYME